MNTQQKNNVLKNLAETLLSRKAEIIETNSNEVALFAGSDPSLLDRLKVTEAKVDGMIGAIEELIKQDDPENKCIYSHIRPDGLKIENRTVPFGTIFIIYESRPDVTIEAAITAFKAGNRILLKGGKEAHNTNLLLVDCWHRGLKQNNVDVNYVTYFSGSREDTQQLIKNNSENLDLIIPRGGAGLIDFVVQNTSVPVLISGRGNNFMYIDKAADIDMAINIALNGKQRISVCNALDKVLIDKNISDADILKLINVLTVNNIKVIGDKYITTQFEGVSGIENENIWNEEFLSSQIMLAVVEDTDEAINLINKHSGGHSAVIITKDSDKAVKFQHEVDCAAVYHNASTRFTDGGQFGLGAEIAISTQKLHSRGPLGAEGLVTNKWFVTGNGQIRE